MAAAKGGPDAETLVRRKPIAPPFGDVRRGVDGLPERPAAVGGEAADRGSQVVIVWITFLLQMKARLLPPASCADPTTTEPSALTP